ncbi:MAG TPA: DUF5666 domain-containing protein [Candidatus Paceibacterota bacterium]
MINKKTLSVAVAAVALAGFAVAAPTHAETSVTVKANAAVGTGEGMGGKAMRMRAEGQGPKDAMKQGIAGKVTSVSGTTLVVAGKQGNLKDPSSADVSYTVDASNATIRKNNADATISSIVVGDNVMVQGTVTGTNVVATRIDSGIMFRMGGEKDDKGGRGNGTSTPVFTGDGKPVVAGTVSSVSGSSVTVTTKAGTSYTVDAANAKVLSGKDTIELSSLASGDEVLVQGEINGTSVTASSIIKGKEARGESDRRNARGFFGGIGRFFAGLFGF